MKNTYETLMGLGLFVWIGLGLSGENEAFLILAMVLILTAGWHELTDKEENE